MEPLIWSSDSKARGLAGCIPTARVIRPSAEEFAGVEDVFGVEGVLDKVMEAEGDGANGLGPPFFLGEADAVFASDDSAEGDDFFEEGVEGFNLYWKLAGTISWWCLVASRWPTRTWSRKAPGPTPRE